jgi:hypothetical protein
MKLDVSDECAPLISSKDGNLRIFMEQKSVILRTVQVGDFLELKLAVLLIFYKRFWCQVLGLFWQWTQFHISLYDFKIFGSLDSAESEYCHYSVVRTFLTKFLSSHYEIP